MYINPIIAFTWRQIVESCLISYIYDEIRLDEKNKALFKKTTSYPRPMPEYMVEIIEGGVMTRTLNRVTTATTKTECDDAYNYGIYEPHNGRKYVTQPLYTINPDTKRLSRDEYGFFYTATPRANSNPINARDLYPRRGPKTKPMAVYA